MAAINKIDKYELGELVLKLSGENKTAEEIAGLITVKLAGLDSISQPSISRWLKNVRLERSEQTKHIVQEHIKATVPKDLEALDEIEQFLLEVFRNRVLDPETELPKDGTYDLKDRQTAGMNALKIIETKLRFAGLLEDPEVAGMRVPKSIEELSDDEIEERLQKFGELKAVK